MKVVVAVDSFKGSLSSLEAGDAVRAGILRACGRWQVQEPVQVQVRPLADGGEGTVEALTTGMGGRLQTVTVTGPVGQRVEAQYGILPDGRTAVMEMAQAAGITLAADAGSSPLDTTTFGVGEMILDAAKKGCRAFIMGIGGSATNDGGIGMLQALGYGLMDAEDRPVPFGAKGLKVLDHITSDAVDPALSGCRFRIACDVANPLCGENGASAIFGPQKGADAALVLQMDRWLGEYAELAKKSFPNADPLKAGTGAAGGLGFAFLTFTNAVLESGIRIVLDETHLEDCVKDADLVITGEGCLDAQTVMGKGPAGVAAVAKKYGRPVVALAGSIREDAFVCNEHGIDAFFPILRRIVTLEQAMDKEIARQNMTDTAEQVMRLFLAGRGAKG